MTLKNRFNGLVDRAKQGQDHLDAAQDKAKAELQQDVDAAKAKAKAHHENVEAKVGAAEDKASSAWSDLKDSWNTHVSKVKSDFSTKEAKLDAKLASQEADLAESDASYAIDVALSAIEEAEADVSLPSRVSLQELKDKSPTDLVAYAEALEIENASSLRKQDLLFAILKALADEGVEIIGSGVLEVLQDGFGFLRSNDSNYLPGPDDIYISPTQIRRFGLRMVGGKGGLDWESAKAMKEVGCVYLSFLGGGSALHSAAIKAVRQVAWDDLVAHYRLVKLKVEELGPLVVGIDSHGNSSFEQLGQQARDRMPEILKGLDEARAKASG